MNCDWRTVRKYVDMEDFNSPPPTPASEEEHESKLDPFKPLINEWLQADKLAPRKQRHTAKRIYRRLKDETDGFNCIYRLVALYVKGKKEQLRLKKTDGYLPLVHQPGEAQADFGFADFYENGKLHKNAKYLVLSFPFSNGGFLQLNYGENMECLLEGMVAMFEHIGGVPTEIWFDNTRTIVTEVIKGGGRNVTERFQRFCEHYRIKPVFMNPESGWEKGFTSKALDEIHKASTRIPRIVNRVCEKSLMYAFQKRKRLIDDYMVKYVVEHEMLGTTAG